MAILERCLDDPRFKYFTDLPEDTLRRSSPRRSSHATMWSASSTCSTVAHAAAGSEMELLTTIGEQVGCLLLLSRLSSAENRNVGAPEPSALVP